MKRFYIKATGSFCYNKTGVTFPDKKQIDLAAIVRKYGGKRLRWSYQWGWRNLPKVLTFATESHVADKIQQAIDKETYGLLVRPKW